MNLITLTKRPDTLSRKDGGEWKNLSRRYELIVSKRNSVREYAVEDMVLDASSNPVWLLNEIRSKEKITMSWFALVLFSDQLITEEKRRKVYYRNIVVDFWK